jgi:MoxR-like ATPase
VLNGEQVLAMRQVAREVPLSSLVRDFAARIVLATHPRSETATDMVNQFVRFGSSPRGAQALVRAAKIRALLDGRYNVAVDDVCAVAPAALRHRVILNFEGEAEGIGTDAVVRDIVGKLATQTSAVAV